MKPIDSVIQPLDSLRLWETRGSLNQSLSSLIDHQPAIMSVVYCIDSFCIIF